MILYHEANPSSLSSILRGGLKRTSRGEKGDDPVVIATDKLLDAHLPEKLQRAGIKRDDNIYAYLTHADSIIDITSGALITIAAFTRRSRQAVLALTVEQERCFVSDLDRYDELKAVVKRGEAPKRQKTLAADYWAALTPLTSFQFGSIARPEAMITYDITPNNIEHIVHEESLRSY